MKNQKRLISKGILLLTAVLCVVMLSGGFVLSFAERAVSTEKVVNAERTLAGYSQSAARKGTHAAKSRAKKVRVAFCNIKGFQETDTNGTKSGYAYDFIQKLQVYSGIRFEFVHTEEMTWNSQFGMLEDGAVDMILGVDYSPERAERYLFSEKSMGTNSLCLLEKENTRVIDPTDVRSADGKVIGFYRGSISADTFRELAEEKGFSYVSVYYDNEESLENALKRGEVELAVTTNMEQFSSGIEIVLEMNPTETFVIFRKGSGELQKKVDDAIGQMDLYEPGWRVDLKNEYYQKAISTFFTRDELDVIKKYRKRENTLTIMCAQNIKPYSWFENGVAKGINVDIFKSAIDTAGLRYRIIEPKSGKEYEEMIEKAVPDIVLDYPYKQGNLQRSRYIATCTYNNVGFAKLIGKSNIGKTYDGRETVAVVLHPRFDFDYIAKSYPNAKFLGFEDYDDCVEAVKKGKADAVYLPSFTAVEYLNRNSGSLLNMSFISEQSADITAAVRDDVDAELLTVLTKSLANVSDIEKDRITVKYTSRNAEKMTLGDLIERYPAIFYVSMFIILTIAVLVGSLYYKNKTSLRLKAVNEQLLKITDENAKYQDLLEKTLEKAETANRAKSIFLSNMSHDIRTPMNAIIGFQTIALAHIDDVKKVSECLKKIGISSRHLLALINDVLDMSRIESEKFVLEETECTIENLVVEVYNMFSSDAEAKGIELRTEFYNIKNNYVYADKLHISRVLLNIIGNSLKFTSSGGQIFLKVEQQPCEEEGKATYIFSINDTGIGMSPEFVEHVFDMFSRERTSTVSGIQGTGLGMAISKNIVEKMGGSINVHSVENRGTDVTITLSLKTREATHEEMLMLGIREEEQEKQELPEGLRVLLVEDNEMNIEIVDMMLRENGFITEIAENGRIAVEKVREEVDNGKTFDFILMDVQMPVMDGYEATRQIKMIPEAKDIPIVAMTANAFEEDKRKAIESGMTAHISKPINFKDIKETMLSILGSKGQEN